LCYDNITMYSNVFGLGQLNPVQDSMENYHSKNKNELFFEMNCDECDTTGIQNKFIATYFRCYQHHGNAVFSPSDLLFILCLSYSKYANIDNVKKFINPDFDNNKKIITVESDNVSYNWKEEISKLVQNIKSDMYDKNLGTILENNLDCSESTIERLACDIAMLKTTENFYVYKFQTRCGFNHIKLIGELSDWKLLEHKAIQMKDYGNEKWNQYIDRYVFIIRMFIESFEGPDINFFKNMINARYASGFYGDTTDVIDGWILNLFYGFKNEYILSEVPNLVAETTGKFYSMGQFQYDVQISSGFCGINISCPNEDENKTKLNYCTFEETNDDDYGTGLKYTEIEEEKKTKHESDNDSDSDNSNNSDDNEEKFQFINDYRPVIYCQVLKIDYFE
jgi:hypothetical protein